MTYTKEETRNSVLACLEKDVKSFYKSTIINRTGRTRDTKEYYTEVIAELLLEKYEYINRIGGNVNIRSSKPFNCGHQGIPNIDRRMEVYGRIKFNEKLLAFALFNSNQEYDFGRVFDYEVPLKEKMSDRHGKIDLVAVKGNAIKLIELKVNNSSGKETLLRAILEIITYYKYLIASKSNFIFDFQKALGKKPDYDFQPVILAEQDSFCAQQLNEINNYPRLAELIKKINQDF